MRGGVQRDPPDRDPSGVEDKIARAVSLAVVQALDPIRRQLESLGAREDDPKLGNVFLDSTWTCARCLTLLAIVHAETLEIRIKQKDHTAWLTLTEGARYRTVCRKCSHENTISMKGGALDVATGPGDLRAT